MIYVVTGFKRSGTSVMMEILRQHGIRPYYSVSFEQTMIKNKQRKNHYYYEDPQKVYNGFTSEDVKLLEGRAIKVLVQGMSNLPDCKKKTIFMKRDWKDIKRSLRCYKSRREVRKEKKVFNSIDMDKLCDEHQVLIVDYNLLLKCDRDTLNQLGEYLQIPINRYKIKDIIDQKVTAKRLRIVVIYVEHSHVDVYRRFKHDLSLLLSPIDFTWIRVQQQDNPTDSLDSLTGDNTYREFSGWDAGLNILDLYEIDYDGVLFVNDTVEKDIYSKLTYERFKKAIQKNMVIGRPQNKPVIVSHGGRSFKRHIRSNLFFFPKPLVRQYGSMVQYKTVPEIIDSGWYNYFLDNIWHNKSARGGKLLSIVNEDMILFKIKSLGYKLIPIFPNTKKKIRYYLT